MSIYQYATYLLSSYCNIDANYTEQMLQYNCKKLIFYRITYPLCQTIKLPINQITTTDDRRSPI